LTAGRVALLVASVLSLAPTGCSADRSEEVELARRADTHDDYRVFAARCSKCHSLARPLNSGIDDDEHWKKYVARMRRQPGSGISAEDTVAILRFLHLYSIEERRRKAGGSVDLPLAPADASPPPDSDPPPAPAEPR
jgi:hypothetical protein